MCRRGDRITCVLWPADSTTLLHNEAITDKALRPCAKRTSTALFLPRPIGWTVFSSVATTSGLGDADDLRDLHDRFAVEVDEADDLAVLR
jgi:hypothetical protein